DLQKRRHLARLVFRFFAQLDAVEDLARVGGRRGEQGAVILVYEDVDVGPPGDFVRLLPFVLDEVRNPGRVEPAFRGRLRRIGLARHDLGRLRTLDVTEPP